MSPRSVREYVAALRSRYRAAGRPTKSRLLDEAERITGYHRKTLIRLLGPPREPRRGPRGRPRRYGPELRGPLQTLWEASDRACGKRLVPFMPTLLEALERHGEISVSPAIHSALLALSPATADRLLQPHRRATPRHPYTRRRPPSALQTLVPVRTFGEWDHLQPGDIQADLVAHCGESSHGFFLTTLVAVDVSSSWTELEAVWGLSHRRVKTAIHRIRARLPFPLHAFHADNGGEFLNHPLYDYCRQEGIRFTRGRPYKKNDQAWVEQRNWTAVRRLVGYDRFATQAAHRALGQLYPQLARYLNFFHPVRKLVAKTRRGPRVSKRYDQPQTPFQRLVAAEVLQPNTRERLLQHYRDLNPIALKRDIDRGLDTLWKLAQKSGLR